MLFHIWPHNQNGVLQGLHSRILFGGLLQLRQPFTGDLDCVQWVDFLQLQRLESHRAAGSLSVLGMLLRGRQLRTFENRARISLLGCTFEVAAAFFVICSEHLVKTS